MIAELLPDQDRSTAASLRLHLTGAPRMCTHAGREIDLSPREAAVLALLAIDGPQPRARLVTMLWPDSAGDAGRNALRQRLFALRRQCGHPVVEGNATIAIAPDVAHDLDTAHTLLGNLQLEDCPALEQWLCAERLRRLAREREALERRIDACEASGDLTSALSLAEDLLRLDPLSEDAHRRMMRLHYLRGDRAAALLAFDRCEATLKHEVGAQPSSETMRLLDSIQHADHPTATTPHRKVPACVIRPPRMIGREALRLSIQRDLAAGAVAVVIGEAGMGKSRLLGELDLDHTRAARAAARPGDAGVPFASLARLSRELLRRCPHAIDGVPRHELARFMPELGPIATSGSDRQRLVLEQAVNALLQSASADIDTLVFDDVHFADEASLDMLQSLVASEHASPMRWILALRPAEADSRARTMLDALAETGRLATTTLQPLTIDDLSELVDTLDLTDLRGAALAPMLHRQSGGNPLFALETIKLMLIDGMPPAAEGAAALPRPSSVLSLIERRLAHLSPMALAVARVAAITAADFSIELAEDVLDQPGLWLADAWHELERAQVLRDCAFAHDLVFEAVLAGIPMPIARHTHARVAAYLSTHAGQPARIAEHWLGADRPRAALPWLKTAAHAAGLALRTKEQFDFLIRAARIEDELGARAEAFATVLAAAQMEGKTGQSLDLALADWLDALAHTQHQRAQALFIRCRQLALAHRFEEAITVGQRALALGDEIDDEMLINDTQHYLGTAMAYVGRHDEAAALFRSVESWMASCDEPKRRMDFHGNFSCVLDTLGRTSEAIAHMQRAIDIARETGLWTQVANGLVNLSLTHLKVGHAQLALTLVLEAEQIYSLYETRETSPSFPANMQSLCARTFGQFRDAMHWSEQAAARAPTTDSAAVTAFAWLRKIETWIDLGQYARAVQLIEQLLETADAAFSIKVSAYYHRARARRLQGERCVDDLTRALDALPSKARPDLHHAILLEQAATAPALQALALTERVIEEARAIGHEGTVMAAHARRAGCLWSHDAALALTAARRALEAAPTLDTWMIYKPELWLNAALAMRAAGLSQEAREALLKARDWIRRCVDDDQVPAPFVDSFLHRNPINREVFALLGCPPR